LTFHADKAVVQAPAIKVVAVIFATGRRVTPFSIIIIKRTIPEAGQAKTKAVLISLMTDSAVSPEKLDSRICLLFGPPIFPKA